MTPIKQLKQSIILICTGCSNEMNIPMFLEKFKNGTFYVLCPKNSTMVAKKHLNNKQNNHAVDKLLFIETSRFL